MFQTPEQRAGALEKACQKGEQRLEGVWDRGSPGRGDFMNKGIARSLSHPEVLAWLRYQMHRVQWGHDSPGPQSVAFTLLSHAEVDPRVSHLLRPSGGRNARRLKCIKSPCPLPIRYLILDSQTDIKSWQLGCSLFAISPFRPSPPFMGSGAALSEPVRTLSCACSPPSNPSSPQL